MSKITVKIKSSQSDSETVSLLNAVEIDTESTVDTLKQAIVDILSKKETVTKGQLRLIYSGRVLKDDTAIKEYKIQEGHTIHMVKSGGAPRSESTTSPATATTPAATPATPNTTAPSTQPAATPLADPFAAMMGNPMGGGFGGVNPQMMQSMMSNPAVMASVSQMMANPQMLDMLMASNPQLSQMITPEMRQLMQSPQFMSMMSNPAVLSSMMQMSSGMMGGAGGTGATRAPGGMDPFMSMFGQPAPTTTTSPTATGTPNQMPPLPGPFMNPGLMQMLMGGAANQNSTQPPEERFQVQLQQLRDMGFYDPTGNVRALTMTNGNVEAAVEYLLNNPLG